MAAQDIVPYAQISTAIIASAALAIATWSLLAQKAIARRRAAIDFFLKTEMDDKMLTAYNLYVAGKAQISSHPDMKAFCLTPHYEPVRAYLNVLELMAVGVHYNTFDQCICYIYWGDFIKRTVTDCQPLLFYISGLPTGGLSFRDLITLEKRWSSPNRFWQRWRR